jgi:hypothetical protein
VMIGRARVGAGVYSRATDTNALILRDPRSRGRVRAAVRRINRVGRETLSRYDRPSSRSDTSIDAPFVQSGGRVAVVRSGLILVGTGR